MIRSDDQEWGDVGFNGHDVFQTQYLDAMAARKDGKIRLYNLKDDPCESTDLSSELPERVKLLRQRLADLQSDCQCSRVGADCRY